MTESVAAAAGSRRWHVVAQVCLWAGGLALGLLLVGAILLGVDGYGLMWIVTTAFAPLAGIMILRGRTGPAPWLLLASVVFWLGSAILSFSWPILRAVSGLRFGLGMADVLWLVLDVLYTGLTVATVLAFLARFGGSTAASESQAPVVLAVNQPGSSTSVNVVVVPQTSSLAIVGFVLVFILSPVGLVLGYLARNEIRQSMGTKTGAGLATATITLGWVFVGLGLVLGGLLALRAV